MLLHLAALLGPLLLPVGDSVEQVLARKPLVGARVALAVADADTGERLFGQRLDEPLAPASNLKLLTTSAAICRLGPDYLFVTRLLGSALPGPDGVLAGDLVLLGGGDPCLREDVLAGEAQRDAAAMLADLLVARGVRRVEGALVLDDGFLDREWLSPHWQQDDLDSDYAAPVSALSIHGNCLSVLVDGSGGGPAPVVRLGTVTEGFAIRNEVKWSSAADTFVVGVARPGEAGEVRVTGSMSRGLGEHVLRVPVIDGALFFGRCLKARLEERGVSVRDGLQREAGAGRSLPGAVELVRYESPLAMAVLLANKESDNSISDHLLKVLGAEVLQDGSFAGGGRAVAGVLQDVAGTSTAGLVMTDGSGLGRPNRVTAHQMVDMLVAMNRAEPESRDLFLRTLPVSGLDGTLRERLTRPPYLGAVRAKTGYILGVSALSGFVHTRSGRVLAFSILINDVPPAYGNLTMKGIQDDICRALVDRW